jgi:hypothetical protein
MVDLYAMVSTEEQAKRCSLPQQIKAPREYAASKSYHVLEEVQDRGQSKASLERLVMYTSRHRHTAGYGEHDGVAVRNHRHRHGLFGVVTVGHLCIIGEHRPGD